MLAVVTCGFGCLCCGLLYTCCLLVVRLLTSVEVSLGELWCCLLWVFVCFWLFFCLIFGLLRVLVVLITCVDLRFTDFVCGFCLLLQGFVVM